MKTQLAILCTAVGVLSACSSVPDHEKAQYASLTCPQLAGFEQSYRQSRSDARKGTLIGAAAGVVVNDEIGDALFYHSLDDEIHADDRVKYIRKLMKERQC